MKDLLNTDQNIKISGTGYHASIIIQYSYKTRQKPTKVHQIPKNPSKTHPRPTQKPCVKTHCDPLRGKEEEREEAEATAVTRCPTRPQRVARSSKSSYRPKRSRWPIGRCAHGLRDETPAETAPLLLLRAFAAVVAVAFLHRVELLCTVVKYGPHFRSH